MTDETVMEVAEILTLPKELFLKVMTAYEK